MGLDIKLFLTSRKDPLPDLRTHGSVEEVQSWFAKVQNVAVKHSRFSEITDEILLEADPHPVLATHAVIFYAPGELLEADEVGEELKVLMHGHRINFDWHVAPNPSIQAGDKEVYLEIIVEKD